MNRLSKLEDYMYKRFIAIVLSLSFVLILTAGCANNEEEANTLESKQTIEEKVMLKQLESLKILIIQSVTQQPILLQGI